MREFMFSLFSGVRSALPALVICTLMAGTTAKACQICIPFPRKSAADYLVESETIVLAREDPERPFHFSAIEILKGDPGEEKIDLFVDSTTRKLLSSNPGHSIILVKGIAPEDPGWRRIGAMNESFGPVVRETLKRNQKWKDNPTDRSAFFAQYLNHEDPQLSRLAHLELASSSYAEIRKYGDTLSRETIHAFLDDIRNAEWRALYILLLAQNAQPSDETRIRKSMEAAARFGSTLALPAWSTALVEIDKEEGIQFLEQNYLSSKGRSNEELQAVVAALSVQGSHGTAALQDRIVSAYRVALDHHPELAPVLVKDLMSWQRNELADRVGKLAMARPPQFDLATMLKLRAYAKSRAATPSTTQ